MMKGVQVSWLILWITINMVDRGLPGVTAQGMQNQDLIFRAIGFHCRALDLARRPVCGAILNPGIRAPSSSGRRPTACRPEQFHNGVTVGLSSRADFDPVSGRVSGGPERPGRGQTPRARRD